MTSTRGKAFSIVLIANVLAMLGGPILAAPHEVCEAMRHGCDKIDALASCCCGDRSEANPSSVASGRADATTSPHAVTAVIATFQMPAVTVLFVRGSRAAPVRPPDLPILFRDLRI